ncbi:MAG: 23S rRNA (guanosine2251-2'-O)-methyltransferase [Pseudohongiellaceae bacterium]|jgi:23S rRNA (guanosine2251-2'-O)-methyltransferase
MSDMQLIFGIHAVSSLIERQPERVEQLYIQKGRHDARMESLLATADQAGLSYQQLERKELDEMVKGKHQGVIAQSKGSQLLRERDLEMMLDDLDHPPLLLILDGVTDPHNLGACLRTADAAGVDAVIVPKDNAAGLNATARKVACGAAEVMPFVQITNLARTLRDLKQRGIWLYGAAGEAEQEIYDVDISGPTALIMGAEGRGLRRLTREHCDYLIKLPMAGSVSSLNVSVATGVCLFEISRQRRRR